MASKKTLNADNLESLGAARLAQLLVEVSQGNAAIKRRLRLELAGAESPAGVVKQIRSRLATIARSRSFIDWQNQKSLVDDLDAQRRAIVDHVATRLPADGLDLMWRFLELASACLPAVMTPTERSPMSSTPRLLISASLPPQLDPIRNGSGTRCSVPCSRTITGSSTG
jgi:hypothetical protein